MAVIEQVTKDELKEVKTLTDALTSEQERLKRLKDWITRLTHELDGMPHDNSFPTSSVESLTVQIVDCEETIKRLMLERMASKSRLIKVIDSTIANNDIKSVLVERYGFGRSYGEISRILHTSESHIFHLHRQGLKALGIKGKL